MSVENKALARRVRLDIWDRGKLNVIDEIYGKECVHHISDPITPDFGRGGDAAKQIVTLYRSAFPDTHMTIDGILADGDTVMVRWTAQGTHKGPLLNLAPTNRSVTVQGIDVYQISAGKIQETWTSWDTLGFLQQLGAVPALGQAKAQAGD
jgi:steroid delta-isomerase-like uncharacterized protein